MTTSYNWTTLRPWISANMEALNCTQSELAVRAGIDEGTMSRGMKPKSSYAAPRYDTLRKLINACPIPLPGAPPSEQDDTVIAIEIKIRLGSDQATGILSEEMRRCLTFEVRRVA